MADIDIDGSNIQFSGVPWSTKGTDYIEYQIRDDLDGCENRVWSLFCEFDHDGVEWSGALCWVDEDDPHEDPEEERPMTDEEVANAVSYIKQKLNLN